MSSTTATSTEQIYSAVRTHYSHASTNRTSSGAYESAVAKAFGYTDAELSSIPTDSNLGLSCGNPLALAALRTGETVLDLGSGAGFDVFLASSKVGPAGNSIGVDMNTDMLAKAERNKSLGGEKYSNVKFVEAPITNMTSVVESNSVDCIISNCVVNLVPEEEKYLVFREMWRVLKPGGRVAISDILIKGDLPDNLKRDMGLYVGCIAGASLITGYEKYLADAGFGDVMIVDNKKDLNVYNADESMDGGAKSCCGTTAAAPKERSCCGTTTTPAPKERSCCGTTASSSSCGPTGGAKDKEATVAAVNVDLKYVDFNAYAGSYNIYAVKSE